MMVPAPSKRQPLATKPKDQKFPKMKEFPRENGGNSAQTSKENSSKDDLALICAKNNKNVSFKRIFKLSPETKAHAYRTKFKSQMHTGFGFEKSNLNSKNQIIRRKRQNAIKSLPVRKSLKSLFQIFIPIKIDSLQPENNNPSHFFAKLLALPNSFEISSLFSVQ